MSNKEAIKKLFCLLVQYKQAIVIISCLMVISSGLNLCIPLLNRKIMDDGFLGGNKKVVISLALATLLIHIIGEIINIFKAKERINISNKIKYSLNERAFNHLMDINMEYYDNLNPAEIVNNINMDIENMSSISDEGMFFVITQLFNILGGIIGLFIINIKLTLLVLLFVPVKYIVMKFLAQKKKRIMEDYIEKNTQYVSWMGDTLGGIQEIKNFGLIQYKYKEFIENQTNVLLKQKKLNVLGQYNISIDVLLVHILISIIYIVGANLVFDMELTVGSIFAFITYSTYVITPITAILNIGYFLSGIIPSTKRFYNFLELEEEKIDNLANIEVENGNIEFRDITFSYTQGKIVLRNKNMLFEKSKKIAIVGKNGSGKSTILKLLTRMYEPIEGIIYLNGIDITRINIKEYRNLFSVVNQNIYLFNTTIRKNICLYKEIPEKQIMEAIKDSGLSDFIDEVTLDYRVGDNGSMLSGGQKQKISLARALIQDRPILLFDEATSNADLESEMHINGLLKTKLKDKTVIVVTHRKEILDEVDVVVEI